MKSGERQNHRQEVDAAARSFSASASDSFIVRAGRKTPVLLMRPASSGAPAGSGIQLFELFDLFANYFLDNARQLLASSGDQLAGDLGYDRSDNPFEHGGYFFLRLIEGVCRKMPSCRPCRLTI
jgi:hypothetical protein